MGIGDLDTQGPYLPSYDIIPSQSPIPIFSIFKKNLRAKKNSEKWRKIFIHFHFGLITFRREKEFSWFKDIMDLGPICDFSVPSSSPYLLSPLCQKGAKMAKKSHSFWKSDFSFEGFESQSLRYLVRLW